MDIKEALVSMFTDDPVNWLKWAVVFAVLIGSYIISIPLDKKVSYYFSRERKRDIARSRGHIIEAALVKKFPTGEVAQYDWHATYRYSLSGEEKEYRAFFRHPSEPPRRLYLYYIDNPAKLFSTSETRYEHHKAIPEILITLMPLLLACLAFWLLRVDISGFV